MKNKQEEVYTSTGNKIIHHPEVLSMLKVKKAAPISCSVAPTSRCNLNCEFCSNTNRNKNEHLSYESIVQLLRSLRNKGLKTVEWTGGGDPTLYPYINKSIWEASSLGLKQGFITNGISLDNLAPVSLYNLTWLRISMNALDYDKNIDFSFSFRGTLGFSYVMNKRTTESILKRLNGYVKHFKPMYVRIVPNCQATDEEQTINNEKFSKLVSSWGAPYFYQKKEFVKPEHCYWGYIKPFVLHDSFVYYCSSVVLNDNADRSFHHKYRWCRIEELPEQYNKEIISFDTRNCDHCVFTKQNDLVDSIINPTGMNDFI